ncbi:MAG: hypothetical protein OEU84_03770 [Xanthomonadales bacterium]|jgi:hypothetical protein|nr:hypothetical protein [Xanthomonadales bacterium]
MKKMLVLCLPTLLILSAVIVPASFAAEKSGFGAIHTQIVGSDNWAWNDTPLSPPTIICPGGELVIDPSVGPYCADSTTGRLHTRDGGAWSCMTSNDPRMTGVGLYTSNTNFDANSSGAVWGTWTLVPTEDCDKDGPYPEELVMTATSFWEGTWSGQRQYYNVNGFDLWIGDLKVMAKGIGGDLDGLQFKGTEWITTYTPFPVPYEFLPPELGLFDDPEGEFIGTIKE